MTNPYITALNWIGSFAAVIGTIILGVAVSTNGQWDDNTGLRTDNVAGMVVGGAILNLAVIAFVAAIIIAGATWKPAAGSAPMPTQPASGEERPQRLIDGTERPTS